MKLLFILLISVYPALYAVCAVLALLFRRRVKFFPSSEYLPSLSIIISSSGEDEAVLKEKLENTITLDYPQNLLEIILFSDGTCIPAGVKTDFPQIRFFEFDRLGKTECQNRSVKASGQEIMISTDVTALLPRDTLRKCVRWYADSRVGAVGGRFLYEFTEANPESNYIQGELKKKERQAPYGYVMGFLGPFYSFRRELYEDMPSFYQSDYIIPLLVASKGFIATIDKEIVSYRCLERRVEQEYCRKRRIVAQGIATTVHFLRRQPLLFLHRPDLFFAIVSYKLFRWLLLPYLSILYLFFVIGRPLHFSPVAVVAAIIVVASRFADRNGWQNAFAKMPYYAYLLLAANIGALFDSLSGIKYAQWKPGSR